MKKSLGAWVAIVATVLLSAFVSGCGTSGVNSGSSATLVSLAVTPANSSIAPGTTAQLTATGTYSNGSMQNLTSSATWTSSNTGIASVGNTGGTKGLATSTTAIGSTTISAIYSGKTATTALNTLHVNSISVTPAAPDSIAPGTTQQFAATGLLTGGTTTQNLTPFATWTSLDPTIGTVSDTAGSKGLATAVSAPGSGYATTTIRATFDSIPGDAALSVSHVASIALDPSGASIANGTKQQFSAIGTLNDSASQNLTSWATWSSSSTSVATISNTAGSKGQATGVGEGTTNISATFDSALSSSATLTVTAPVLQSISITPSTQSIVLGLTQQYGATGHYSDGTTPDITSSVTWHSSNTSIASINSSGLATSSAQGTTTITASLPSITSNSATLTVTPAELVSIAISPPVASLIPPNTQQFVATGTFTDNTTSIVTSSVTWHSSNQIAATINNTGLATAKFITFPVPDTTNITATSSTITSNTAVLTVHY